MIVPSRRDSGQTTDEQLALRTATASLQHEFRDALDPDTIERVLYTSHDQFTADSAIMRFLRAKRFARQQLQALARVDGHHPDSAPVVVFVSAHDDGCSPMALGFLQHLAEDRAIVWSGGSEPSNEVNPTAMAAMRERGIDISSEFPKPWTDDIIHAADFVITINHRHTCPITPGTQYLTWEIGHPTDQSLDAVRPVRDELEQHVRALVDDLRVLTCL